MKILVTGASGFLGQYVVAAALSQGYQVRAAVRPSTAQNLLPWYNHPAVEVMKIDLRTSDLLSVALQGIDVVIHLAAAKQGDFDTQYADTVVATENLLQAMVVNRVLRLVAISTFSVFDYFHIPTGATIDEESITVQQPQHRDVYAQVKLLQENLFRRFEQQDCGKVTIIRPGMIYGRDNLWNACLGVKVSDRLWIRIGDHAQMPLTYVENCADSIVKAVECDQAIGKTLNIVDNDLPNQRVYAEKIAQFMTRSPYTITISWTVMCLVAQFAWQCNRLLLANKIKLPGLFVPARLHARFKPLSYSNVYAQQVLKWQPKYSLDAALERSCSDINLLTEQHQLT
ncbi:NAD-dependent epimerase/dehydratase family protein [Aliinostoc sp. HNIBRCY26]|uniref:NAD-dependent epimerase/dehydratase family protein n=1 Tax=Aliinostoc sp. HNIBRCY26 TaxID=3418997 RepID=UPI003D04BED0